MKPSATTKIMETTATMIILVCESEELGLPDEDDDDEISFGNEDGS